ncbi:16S rRNA (guanine966-N2)-methyltransferase [Alkalibacillus filiformis]|uniref:16S rRNA (Guanine966-N2)-methyltransferase n=1 Tax=Alkalibacillus filiformis TaxID=200990 RepID=A0ABU0DPW4_9BACI|nr:16S rRNA (guanine(966)-N(2))-methyltransferase RsmD [Alkalibacillus filiformis]MDQ0350490.1 16S rRNA (guanine966-N2)-methyltransferase [Alkalibacillus filiformis]
MRVISGRFKGHPLKAVPNMKTRPTTDKVKESLFHQIGPYFDGGSALDLFAGSGNLGIEAISRGMSSVVFVDHQYPAIQTVKDNVKKLKISDQCEIFRNDAIRAVKAAGKHGKKFDYIFLDPPYRKVSFDKIFNQLIKADVLVEGAMVICEHDPNDELPLDLKQFEVVKQDTYSSTISITIFSYNLGGKL